MCIWLPAMQRSSSQRLLSHSVCCRMHWTQRLRLSGKSSTLTPLSDVFICIYLYIFSVLLGNISITFPPVALQACHHLNDSGVCKENCPPPTIYDTVTFQSKPNPNKKFSFGATCIKTCPCEILFQEKHSYAYYLSKWFNFL